MADTEERGAGNGRQPEDCRISSSGGITGSRYSSSGGFKLLAACRTDELLLVELDEESLNDAGAAESLRSKQLSMSSYISPATADCAIKSYKSLSSSGQLPFSAKPLFWGVGGSGRARFKNLLVRFSFNSFTLSSSVLLSPMPTINKCLAVINKRQNKLLASSVNNIKRVGRLNSHSSHCVLKFPRQNYVHVEP